MIEIKNICGEVIFTSPAETLSKADLRGCNLRGADLRGTDLSGANLCGAGLRGADLRNAKLSRADLIGADLRRADLSGADLRAADLSGAILRDADLSNADLRGCDFTDADLTGANLPLFCKWEISVCGGLIEVGCVQKTAPEWLEWLDSEEEFETPRSHEDFKRIRAAILAAVAI